MTPRCPIPVANELIGLQALGGLVAQRSPLAAMQVFHAAVGNVFWLNIPVFNPVVVVGPEVNRQLLVTDRAKVVTKKLIIPMTRNCQRELVNFWGNYFFGTAQTTMAQRD